MRKVALGAGHPRMAFVRGLVLVIVVMALMAGGVAAAPVGAQGAPARYELVTGVERGAGAAPDRAGVWQGYAAVSVSPAAGIGRVRYFLDPSPADLQLSTVGGKPLAVVTAAPFALGGPAGLDTRALADGPHTLVAAIDLLDGRTVVKTMPAQVWNGGPALLFGAAPLQVVVRPGARVTRELPLLTSTGDAVRYTLAAGAAWLKPAATLGGLATVELDAAGLAPGEYSATLTASAAGHAPATTTVTLAVTPQADCAPLDCAQVKVATPYVLNFDQDRGGLDDKNGVGMGFTWVDKPTAGGTGYLPANLEVNLTAGLLGITTTPGIAYLAENNQDNTLGVGIDAANQVSVLETRLVNFPPYTPDFQQAGLWYGTDDDNYLKLAVVYELDGPKVQFVEERNGVQQQQVVTPVIALAGPVQLRLSASSTTSGITAYYGLDGGPLQEFHTFIVPPELFNGGGAVIDPAVGTAVFGGVFATDRFLQGTAVFQFDYFSLTGSGGQFLQRLFLPLVIKG